LYPLDHRLKGLLPVSSNSLSRLVVCVIAATLFSACAADDPILSPNSTGSVDGDQTSMAMDGMDETDMAGDLDHEHDPTAVTEWEGAPPQLEVVISDGLITLEAIGFEFAAPDETENVPGRGHTHVLVDGRLVSMSYERAVPLPDLEPGTHEIEITLAAIDHSDYVIGGVIVGATTEYVVEGEVAAADMTVTIEYTGGNVVMADPRPSVPLGSLVEIVLMSDVSEELHIHGYDLTVEVGAGETRRVRFTADIPGIFEVELERSGTPVLDLTVS
jgi:hypothetical protein